MSYYVVFAVVSLLLIGATYANAQEGETSGGYLISPVREELFLDKGKSETVILTIENVTEVPTTAKAIVNNFGPSADESGQPAIDIDGKINFGNSFVELVEPIEDVKLEPNTKVEVPVTITVPNDASPGGYYGVVRFASTDQQGDANVSLSASIGTIFLVTVPGEFSESMELVELSSATNSNTKRLIIGDGSDLQIVTRLNNTGNIHLQPFGKISITNSSGEVVETYEFNSGNERANVLPDSIRAFVDEIQYDKFFGKYTVTANLGYGDGGGLITAKNTFWVVPLWVVIVSILAIVAIIIAAFLLYRKLMKSRKHKVKPRR